jgi:hypothetical protein
VIRYWWNIARIYWMASRFVRREQRRADAEGRKEIYEATITSASGRKIRIKGDPL